jgi:hypothetical protein
MNREKMNSADLKLEYCEESVLEKMLVDCGVHFQPPTKPNAIEGGMYLGEIVDTHNPHLTGRVLVRWLDAHGASHEHWLAYAANTRAQIGVRVLLTRPANWSEWVVVSSLVATGPQTHIVEDSSPANSVNSTNADTINPDHQRHTIRLEANEPLHVETADGKPLFELLHRDTGAVLRLGSDLNLELPGTFRVDAERIELHSGQSGTDNRSEGEVMYRASRIRLN